MGTDFRQKVYAQPALFEFFSKIAQYYLNNELLTVAKIL